MRRTIVSALALSLCLSGSIAQAQSLDAADPVEVGRAIAAAGHAGDRALATALAARIERGLPGPLLTRAIDALVSNGSPPATSALLELASHRRAAVRAYAARSLARGRSPSARRVLAELLDDPDAAVRSAAAVALGEVGAQGVLDTVMLAALRGVPEAAILFGQQASALDVARLLRQVDPGSLDATAPALRILLERAQVARPTKLAIVRRLAELRGALSERLLREVGATMIATDPVRVAIDAALEGEAPAVAPTTTPAAAPRAAPVAAPAATPRAAPAVAPVATPAAAPAATPAAARGAAQ